MRDYDSTVARIAGNIASGLAGAVVARVDTLTEDQQATVVEVSVDMARKIVALTRRTESASGS